MIEGNHFLIIRFAAHLMCIVLCISKNFFLGRNFIISSKSIKVGLSFQSLLYFESKMAFQKPHAKLVSSWPCRHWHLRINIVQGSVVSTESVGNSRDVLSAVRELGTIDPVRGWSSH